MVRRTCRPSRTSRARGAVRDAPVSKDPSSAVAVCALGVGVRPRDGVADRHRHRPRREREARDRDRVIRGEDGTRRRPTEMASNRRPPKPARKRARRRRWTTAIPSCCPRFDSVRRPRDDRFSRSDRSRRREYPHRPMATTHRPDTLARERAHELVRSWDGRPGALGQPARPGQQRRPGRRRGAGRQPEEALDQEGLEAVGPRPRDPDDRPDDARGEGHAGQDPGARGEGDPPPARRPHDPVASPRCASTRRSSRRPRTPSRARPSRSPRSRPGSRRARRSATSRSPRRGPPPRPAPTRSTWSSTAARSSAATT